MSRSKGFTLIELLVVLFVLSLVAGVTVFSMGVFQSSHDLENTTQALSSRLRLAQMEATFDQEAVGIAVDETGYRFYRKNPQFDKWELITDDTLFKSQSFPDKTDLQFMVAGKIQSLTQAEPQLILQQGDVAPFSLTFKEGKQAYEISLNPQGEIVWTPL